MILIASHDQTLLGGSYMIAFDRNRQLYAAGALISACLIQGFVYNVMGQSHFWLSLLGFTEGIVMVLIDATLKQPGLSPERRQKWVQHVPNSIVLTE
jgi:hypothetical protein